MSDQNALGVSPSPSSSVNTSSSPKPSLTEHKQQVSVTAPGPLNLEICKSNIEFIKYPWYKLHDRSSTHSIYRMSQRDISLPGQGTLNNVMISIRHLSLVKFIGILTWFCFWATAFLSFDIVIPYLHMSLSPWDKVSHTFMTFGLNNNILYIHHEFVSWQDCLCSFT